MARKDLIPLISLDQVKPEQVQWLWPSRIPLGKITILQGDPGLGKSTLALDVAARVTRNLSMPDGTISAIGASADVFLMSAEDGLSDTIRPRLDAAGADQQRIHVPKDQHYVVPKDTGLIRNAVLQTGAKLVILDPLAAFLEGSVNTWNNQHVRRALAPLAQVAESQGAAILILDHLNKRTGISAIQRGSGSIAFNAAARSVLLVCKHPEDSEIFVLAGVKSNLGAAPASLAYHTLEAENKAVKLAWRGECPYTADDLATFKPAGSRRLATASDFLSVRLAKGSASSKVVEREAVERGISLRTLTRARKQLRVVSKPTGLQGEWRLSLPVNEVLKP